jgi:hypothetical protein
MGQTGLERRIENTSFLLLFKMWKPNAIGMIGMTISPGSELWANGLGSDRREYGGKPNDSLHQDKQKVTESVTCLDGEAEAGGELYCFLSYELSFVLSR